MVWGFFLLKEINCHPLDEIAPDHKHHLMAVFTEKKTWPLSKVRKGLMRLV